LKVSAVLKHARVATGVEDWIYATWADILVNGTVAQLAIMPGKEWSDMNLAAMHKILYEQAITKTRIRDSRGVQLMVRQRPFL
jgi:chromosome segregation and condensation protein ScpB